jgi:hypothetical protein
MSGIKRFQCCFRHAGELLGLTVADIDFDRLMICPRKQADDRTRVLRELKTKRSRTHERRANRRVGLEDPVVSELGASRISRNSLAYTAVLYGLGIEDPADFSASPSLGSCELPLLSPL